MGRASIRSVSAVSLTATLALAACGSGAALAPSLVSISLDPPEASVAAGLEQRFTAIGRFSDGTQAPLQRGISWSPSSGGVATVDLAGSARGLVPGAATITARETATGLSATASLSVTAAVLQSVSVEPSASTVPAGLTEYFSAQGHLTDGSVSLLTEGVEWSSSQAGTAGVDADGVAHGLASGDATITARHGASGLSGTAALTVADAILQKVSVEPPSASAAPGLAQRFTAVGQLSDGGRLPLATGLTWVASAGQVATVDEAGWAQAGSTGTATITVTHAPSGLSGAASLTVTSATLESLAISPGATSVPKGLAVQLAATARCSDGSSGLIRAGLTWSADDPTVASVDSSGLARALLEGTTGVAASHLASGLTASASLTTTPAVLLSMSISPETATLAVHAVPGLSRPFTVTGRYSDGASRTLGWVGPIPPLGSVALHWSTSLPSVAGVSVDGEISAVSAGTATLTATEPGSGLAASAILHVVPDVLQSVSVDPATASVAVGRSAALSALGHYLSGGTRVYGQSVVAWSSSDRSVATVSAGMVTGVAPGTATITARDPASGLSGAMSLSVTP